MDFATNVALPPPAGIRQTVESSMRTALCRSWNGRLAQPQVNTGTCHRRWKHTLTWKPLLYTNGVVLSLSAKIPPRFPELRLIACKKTQVALVSASQTLGRLPLMRGPSHGARLVTSSPKVLVDARRFWWVWGGLNISEMMEWEEWLSTKYKLIVEGFFWVFHVSFVSALMNISWSLLPVLVLHSGCYWVKNVHRAWILKCSTYPIKQLWLCYRLPLESWTKYGSVVALIVLLNIFWEETKMTWTSLKILGVCCLWFSRYCWVHCSGTPETQWHLGARQSGARCNFVGWIMSLLTHPLYLLLLLSIWTVIHFCCWPGSSHYPIFFTCLYLNLCFSLPNAFHSSYAWDISKFQVDIDSVFTCRNTWARWGSLYPTGRCHLA